MKLAALLAVFLCLTTHASAAQNRGAGNKVEGEITVEGKTYRLSHAYGKVIDSPNDKTRPMIFLLLSDRPINKADVESPSRLKERLQATGSVLVDLRIEGTKLFFASVDVNGETLLAKGWTEESFDFKPEIVTARLIKATASTRGVVSDHSGKKYNFDARFDVPLRKGDWTGAFYTAPPTGLAPGKATGKLIINGKELRVNHVYGERRYNFFDEKSLKASITFTEKPVGENALASRLPDRLKRTGNPHEIKFDFEGRPREDNASAFESFQVFGLEDDSTAVIVFGYEKELVRFDGKSIEGRIYTLKPQKVADTTYEMDISFNSPIREGANPPVTSMTGKPLPPGGGQVGQAYLAHQKAIKETKSYDELYQLLSKIEAPGVNRLRSGDELEEEMKSAPGFQDPKKMIELMKALFELRRSFSDIQGMTVTGGFIDGDRATLSFAGVDGNMDVAGRVNMHLENGQWKLGASQTMLTERQAAPTAKPSRAKRKRP
ncbi:MAG TPA: hypothetical protein VJQ56_03535 [Blastocatellia bacterium]|nr:hypothetical protein [Blastocatellia bacterium]